MGTYYPEKDDHCFNSTECPLFWQYHKIPLVPVNFTNEEYYDNVKIAAMSGMAINIIGVVISSCVLINSLLKKDYFVEELRSMNLIEKLLVGYS